jgi:two-component sensor histidine kinase
MIRIMAILNRYPGLLYLLILLLDIPVLSGQVKPVAEFSFNEGKDYDEVSGRKAKLVNVTRCKDRFGNENHAVFVAGSNFSYINLGTYKALKPDQGTISMWVKLDGVIYSGLGGHFNPILLTKQTKIDDFYESYCIYYFYDTKKFTFINSRDSLTQVVTYSKERDYLNKWLHMAISYDRYSLSLYINGKLESRIRKNFPTKFLNEDSVMVGHTANKKNLRFLCGTVDDIQFYDQILTDDQIADLYNAPDPNKNSVIYKWLLAVAALIALFILLYFYTRYRVKAAVKTEKERSSQANVALENELRVHRALMNPHFIFNTLNGMQDLLLKKEYEGASDYLIKFSQLLRKILESNMSDVISLELEIELLQRYIEIEDLRFEESFSYSITVDPAIVPSITIIPIMMLQPFVENAIWHGLRAKEGDKSISISFARREEKYLECVIEDNGLGRQESQPAREKKSLATIFIRQRLALLNKIHDLDCNLHIEARPDGTGTRVTLILPILNG